MQFRKSLISGLVSLILAAGVGGCKRQEPLDAVLEKDSNKTRVETRVNDYESDSCDLYVYNEWVDLNENKRRDKGEFYQQDRFLTTEDIEFYVFTSQSNNHSSRFSLLLPNSKEIDLHHEAEKGKSRFHFKLPDKDKMVGQYTVRLYINDELKQEKYFEVVYPLYPSTR